MAILRRLDFQHPSGLLDDNGNATQWEGYVQRYNDVGATCGITLGSPGTLPASFTTAARFESNRDPYTLTNPGKPRSMAKLSKGSLPDAPLTLEDIGGDLDAAEGLERWYRWWVYFPADLNIPTHVSIEAPTVFMAWHGDSGSGDPSVPALQFHLKRYPSRTDDMKMLMRMVGGRNQLRSQGLPSGWTPEGSSGKFYVETLREYILTDPIQLAHWYDIRMYAKFSATPANARLKVWLDGNLVLENGVTTPAEPSPSPSGTGAILSMTNGVPSKLFIEQGLYLPLEGKKTSKFDLSLDNPYNRYIYQTGLVIADSEADILQHGGDGTSSGGGSQIVNFNGAAQFETWETFGSTSVRTIDAEPLDEEWSIQSVEDLVGEPMDEFWSILSGNNFSALIPLLMQRGSQMTVYRYDGENLNELTTYSFKPED